MEQVIKKIEELQLATPSRKRHLVYQRMYLYKYLRETKLLTIAKIGRLFNKDHATVIYSLKQFDSILEVLVASTDARDPITAGHSIRVTEYVMGICRKLGLSAEYTDMIRVASLLHDYGKIGVEDEILKKPGRLSPEQYEAIKTHADKSRRILEKIQFEGVYREVPSIVGSHHERIDGTGYPKGLKGPEIPLGSKIIAVADVFEALTSRRQYREPVPADQALEFIDRVVFTEITVHHKHDIIHDTHFFDHG